METPQHDSDLELLATIRDPDTDVEADAITNVAFGEAQRLMKRLPQAECDAITWSFGLNGVGELSLLEIGQRLRCSKTTAWEIRERGLTRLRRLLGVADVDADRDPSGRTSR